MSQRKGILAAGNWIIDDIKIIDEFPPQDGLANILSEKSNNGGAPYNLLKDLSYMKAEVPLEAMGLVGADEKGQQIIEECNHLGINTKGIIQTRHAPTSHTDVMTVASTGRRTFFHNRGANARFGREHINLEFSNAAIFHLAYILLLDQLDEVGQDGRTMASHIFEQAQQLGFKTSTDIVSEASDRFQKIIPPSLPYIDYLFINEYEAHKLTGIEMMDGQHINLDKAGKAALKIAALGVKEFVILHFPEGALVCNEKGVMMIQPSLEIPGEKIKGSAGAGDAFAAGVLLGLHEHWSLEKCLKTGILAATSSLFDESCSDGILPMDDLYGLERQYDYRSL